MEIESLLSAVLTPRYVELDEDISRLIINKVIKIAAYQLCYKR